MLAWLCRAPTITTYRVNLLQTTVERFKQTVEKLLAEKYANSVEAPEVFTIPDIPEVLCIGRHKGAQLKEPECASNKEIVVDSCCAAALLRGAHIYAPGVLAMEAGTQLGAKVSVFADLTGKCKQGTSSRYATEQKMFIGIGVVRMQRHALYGVNVARNGIAIEMKDTISGVPVLGDLSGPHALLQNLPSIVCVRALDPQPGERVLDMCAAPGNKTSHIVEMMRDQGIVVALDKTETKINYVREKMQANNVHCVRAFAFDATLASSADVKACRIAHDVEIKPPFAYESFDRVLLDAPCSALGNRPLLRSTMTAKMLQSFPNVQRKLFHSAVRLLKPNGILVYSTCTVTIEENEGMVAWALKKFPELKLMDVQPKLMGHSMFGSDAEQCTKVQRFCGPYDMPADAGQQYDTVGFFIAKFIKRI